jgi:VWFA-related protein
MGIFSTYGTEIAPFTADVSRLVSAIDGMRPRALADFRGTCPALSAFESYVIADDRDNQVFAVKTAETAQCNPYWSPERVASYVKHMAQANWAVASARSQNTLAALRSIVNTMGSLEGRRMALLVSSGFLTETLAREQDSLVAHALRAGVAISSLDVKGVYTLDLEISPGGSATSLAVQRRTAEEEMIARNSVMAGLAQSTGGRFFHGNNDIDTGFRELAAQPEVTYLLAFRPEAEPDGTYHRLQVRLKGVKGHSIQARPGYYASKDEPFAPVAERRIDRELFAEGTQTEVPVTVTTAVRKRDNGPAELVATVHVDVKRLNFLPKSGRRSEKLAFLVAILDDRGNVVEGKEGSMEFALRQETYAWLVSKGVSADFQLTPGPGKYRLRAIIEAASQGQITLIDQMIVIP